MRTQIERDNNGDFNTNYFLEIFNKYIFLQ